MFDFGFAASGGGQSSSGVASEGIESAIRLGAEVDGTRDEIIFMAKGIDGASSVEIQCGMLWRELL